MIRHLLYRQHRALTPAAAISIETFRLTGRWRGWVRPLDQRAFRPATAVQLDAMQWCDTPAEVRAVLAGGAR